MPVIILCLHTVTRFFDFWQPSLHPYEIQDFMIIFLFLALQLEDVQEFFKPVIQQASSFEVMFKKCESSQCRGLQAPYRGLQAPCVIVSLYYHTNDVRMLGSAYYMFKHGKCTFMVQCHLKRLPCM